MKYNFEWCAFTADAEIEVDCQITGDDGSLTITMTRIRTLNSDGVVIDAIDCHGHEDDKTHPAGFLKGWVMHIWSLEQDDVLHYQRDL